MSINNIVLSPVQLVDFYGKVLVEMNTTNAPANEELRYLGNNERGVLIVTNHEEAVYLPDNELQFLTSILTACKLSLSDVAIVNRVREQRLYKELIENLHSSKVLLFGIDPSTFGLPIQFPHFQIQEFDKRTYLSAPVLSLVENDVALKKNLWNSLKLLFEI